MAKKKETVINSKTTHEVAKGIIDPNASVAENLKAIAEILKSLKVSKPEREAYDEVIKVLSGATIEIDERGVATFVTSSEEAISISNMLTIVDENMNEVRLIEPYEVDNPHTLFGAIQRYVANKQDYESFTEGSLENSFNELEGLNKQYVQKEEELRVLAGEKLNLEREIAQVEHTLNVVGVNVSKEKTLKEELKELRAQVKEKDRLIEKAEKDKRALRAQIKNLENQIRSENHEHATEKGVLQLRLLRLQDQLREVEQARNAEQLAHNKTRRVSNVKTGIIGGLLAFVMFFGIMTTILAKKNNDLEALLANNTDSSYSLVIDLKEFFENDPTFEENINDPNFNVGEAIQDIIDKNVRDEQTESHNRLTEILAPLAEAGVDLSTLLDEDGKYDPTKVTPEIAQYIEQSQELSEIVENVNEHLGQINKVDENGNKTEEVYSVEDFNSVSEAVDFVIANLETSLQRVESVLENYEETLEEINEKRERGELVDTTTEEYQEFMLKYNLLLELEAEYDAAIDALVASGEKVGTLPQSIQALLDKITALRNQISNGNQAGTGTGSGSGNNNQPVTDEEVGDNTNTGSNKAPITDAGDELGDE